MNFNKWKQEHVLQKTTSFLENTEPSDGGHVKVIGEIGINHNGDMETAKRLIDVAEVSGCDYVKFQKRNPDVCVPEHKKPQLRETPWGEIPYIDYKYKVEFSVEEFKELKDYCVGKDIGIFSSVWDIDSAEEMSNVTDIGKIPSAHLTNEKLVKATRVLFPVMIMSTGMSTEEEIDKILEDVTPDVLMHSVSAYPTKIEDVNLSYIRHLVEKVRKNGLEFKTAIGYSGHETEIITAAAAVAMGATWIERHITLDREMWGSDQFASLEPDELYEMVKIIRQTEKSIGDGGPRKLLDIEKDKRKSLRTNL